MVVDDDPAVLRLLIVVFQVAGWEVLAFEGAEMALEVLETFQPAVVITDLDMPGVDGEEFHTRSRENGFEGRFVVISGEPNGRLKSARMGAPHVQKPFDPFRLIELVEELSQIEDGVGTWAQNTSMCGYDSP